jgi:plastocyanin
MNKFRLIKRVLMLVIIVVIVLVLGACSSTPTSTPATTSTTLTTSTLTTVPKSTLTSTATPTPTPTLTPTPTSSTTSTPGPNVTLDLIAQGMAFDKGIFTVQAGASVTVNFNNKDGGIPHNFALYTDSSATTPIFVGQTINGQATISYKFTAPATAGTYFFRCDIHPTSRTGSFIVTP